MVDAVPAASQVVERGVDLREVGRQLVDRPAARRRARSGSSDATRATTPGPAVGGWASSHEHSPRRSGSSTTPRTWHCIVIAIPTAATSHQPRRPPDHARHAPASAMALESAMRFGFQMKVDSSIAAADTAMSEPGHEPGHRSTDRARQPPRDSDRRDRRPSAISATTASGESPPVRKAAGTEQVVVAGAVVDIADRRRRAEERHDPVADERPQDQHVVALIAVPCAAGGEVGQAEQGSEHEQADQDEQIPPARADPRRRSPRPRPTQRPWVRPTQRPWARPTQRPWARLPPPPTTRSPQRPPMPAHAGAVRDRLLPRSSKASGGRSGAARPASERASAGQVDRVVALVHPWRLEVVRACASAGMAQQMAETGRADPARAEVLVPIQPRAAARPASRSGGASPADRARSASSKSARKASMAAGVARSIAGPPGVGRVQAEPDALPRHPASVDRRRDAGELVEIHAEPEPTAGRVLEDEHASASVPSSSASANARLTPSRHAAPSPPPHRTRDANRCGR